MATHPGGHNNIIRRAEANKLKEIFEKYSSREENGEKLMTNEDFVVKYLQLLPAENYNADTLSLFAGVIDSNKDNRISFDEFLALERRLCKPDALYRTIFQLFDTNGGGSVSFLEFKEIMSKTLLHKKIPFDLDTSFVQLYFGHDRKREVVYPEFCQFLHHYHEKYSKYAFKAADSDGDGRISAAQFCDIMVTIKSHLLTGEVRRQLLAFIQETEGDTLSFAYCTAFRAMLANMEEMKKIYLDASRGSRVKEVTKAKFLHSAQRVSQATPLEIDILFQLSNFINRSESIIYSDLQKLAPEVYMKNVTRRLVDIKLVHTAEDRTGPVRLLESLYRFFVGSMSGLLGAGAVYPIDLVKTRMMNQRAESTEMVSRIHAYQGTVDCAAKTLRYEGVAGLYRGLGLYLLTVAPEKAIKLATNDLVRDKISEASHGHITLAGELVAGACSGLANVVFTNPLEILKIRLQVAGSYSTLAPATAASVLADLGLRNVYRACAATALRDVTFCSLYFPLYAHLKPVLADQTGYNSPFSIFLAGALAGAPAASLVTPIDLIKTRLQVIRRPGQARYDGILDCAAKIYRDEGGLRAFWKGNLANKIKSTPQFGITLVLYEIIQRVFFVDFGGSKPSGSCRERVGAEVLPSSHPDHIGGFSVAQPIFVGMESKFGLFFPKFRHKETWCQNGDGE